MVISELNMHVLTHLCVVESKYDHCSMIDGYCTWVVLRTTLKVCI